MTRTKAKELLPAITHFAKGGDLWWCDTEEPLSPNSWKKQIIFGCNNEYKIMNIIEDKHLEARKAYALGKDIETSTFGESWEVVTDESALWTAKYYRPKPKEVYECQWLLKYKNKDSYELTGKRICR